jgi:HAD superfamily hydrolase (TIGR01509 family)
MKLRRDRAPASHAVLFDIDGTLIDSVDLHAAAWHETLRRFGHDFPYATVRLQIGKGGDQLLATLIGAEETRQRGEEIERACGTLFAERYMKLVRPFPGVRPLFRLIKDHGHRLALASSCEQSELKHYKKLLKIDDLIDVEVCGDEVERSKPDPQIFTRVMGKLGMDAAQALAVGDTPYDAEAAGKAGIRTIGLLSGGFERRGLEAAGCVAVYADLEALHRAYEQSPLAGLLEA